VRSNSGKISFCQHETRRKALFYENINKKVFQNPGEAIPLYHPLLTTMARTTMNA